MSQICRTCLQKANITFKTSQQLGDFDEEGPVMIGKALKYCIKDIYLGLSVNTDICLECKENLKISYAFKKQCAKTDSIILNFLRNARCTGKSVDLYDVVTELNREHNFAAAESSLQVKTTTADDINLNTDDFHTFYQTHITDEKPIEVRESAPNTTVAKPKKPFKGGILNEYGKVANELIKKLKTSSTELVNPVVNVALERSKETVPTTTTTTTSNLCQISNVFSLNDISGNSKSNVGDITHMDTGEEPNFVNNILDIKEEPIDIDITDNPLNFPSFTPTDEDTLDASETSIFEKSYDSNVQGSSYDPNVQGSILEVNHPDQYVDIPDFVTINNFGFKELEELRLQQKINNEVKSKSVLKPLTDMPNNIILAPKDTIANGSYQGLKVVNLLSNLPDVLILEDGKRMVKCGNGYKIDNAQGQAQDDAQEPPKPKDKSFKISCDKEDSSQTMHILPEVIVPPSSSSASVSNCADDPTCVPLETEEQVQIEYVKKRSKDKKDYCMFCNKDVFKFARHLYLRHKTEDDVKHIFSFGVCTKERREALSRLRKRCDYVQNSTNSKLRPVKRTASSSASQKEDYLSCPYCFGLYKRRGLHRHTKICSKNKKSNNGKGKRKYRKANATPTFS